MHNSFIYKSLKELTPPIIFKGLKKVMTVDGKDSVTIFEDKELDKISTIARYKELKSTILGREIFIPDSASFIFMFREIFRQKIYNFISKNQAPLIIDCGANIGLSIIFFKKLYPKSRIIAFEPDPKIFNVLNENIKSFGFSDTRLIDKALWDEETTLDFFSEGADGGSANNIVEKENIIKIKTTRLRDYLKEPVAFLKIDIEGAELKVIKDSEDCLFQVDNMFIEYHSVVGQSQELSSLLSILERNGFRYHLNSPGLVSSQPFITLDTYNNMDGQLNIYAFRQ